MKLDASTHIARSPHDVFEYVTDISHDAEWRTGVVEAALVSAGPMAVGARGFDRAEARGKSMVSEWRIVEYVVGSHARWHLTSGPFHGSGGYRCEPDGVGTRFTIESDVSPTGWYRLLGPVFRMVGKRQNKADVEELKRLLETSND